MFIAFSYVLVRVGLAASGAEQTPASRTKEKGPTKACRVLLRRPLGDAAGRPLVPPTFDRPLARRGLRRILLEPRQSTATHAHHLRQSHVEEAQGPGQEEGRAVQRKHRRGDRNPRGRGALLDLSVAGELGGPGYMLQTRLQVDFPPDMPG